MPPHHRTVALMAEGDEKHDDPQLAALSDQVADHFAEKSMHEHLDDHHHAEDDCDAHLTATELEWIAKTRDAVKQAGFTCSNVMLVQLAIVGKGDGARGIQRLTKMKHWEEDPTIAGLSGTDAFQTANAEAMEGKTGFCAAGRRAKNGALTVGANYGDYRPSHLKVPLGIKAVTSVFDGCCSSLADVRRGVSILVNCKHVGHHNISLSHEYHMAELYVHGYPIRINQFVLVDVTAAARILLKGLLKVFPHSLAHRMHIVLSDELGEYYDQDALPQFLAGTNPPNSEEWWTEMRSRRDAWEVELTEHYGNMFEKL